MSLAIAAYARARDATALYNDRGTGGSAQHLLGEAVEFTERI